MESKSIWRKIKDLFSTEEELNIEVKPIVEEKPKKIKKDICNLMGCKRKLNIINSFNCHYCKKYFCDKHRLPELHNCKAKLITPKEMRAGTGFESFSSERK